MRNSSMVSPTPRTHQGSRYLMKSGGRHVSTSSPHPYDRGRGRCVRGTRFSGRSPPPLKKYLPDQTILTGSLSKIVRPRDAPRVGLCPSADHGPGSLQNRHPTCTPISFPSGSPRVISKTPTSMHTSVRSGTCVPKTTGLHDRHDAGCNAGGSQLDRTRRGDVYLGYASSRGAPRWRSLPMRSVNR